MDEIRSLWAMQRGIPDVARGEILDLYYGGMTKKELVAHIRSIEKTSSKEALNKVELILYEELNKKSPKGAGTPKEGKFKTLNLK